MRRTRAELLFAVLFVLAFFATALSYAAGPLAPKIPPASASPPSPSSPAPVLTPAQPTLEVQQVGLPDLVIQAISPGIPARVGTRVEVPYSVRVRNIGRSPANIFKVSVAYHVVSFPIVLADRLTVREGVIAFTVPGQSNVMFPFTGANLNAGDEVTFTGKLSFPTIFDSSFDENTPEVRIRFEAFADSSQGEGSTIPSYGRVRESNESNNTSNPIVIEMSITRGPADR